MGLVKIINSNTFPANYKTRYSISPADRLNNKYCSHFYVLQRLTDETNTLNLLLGDYNDGDDIVITGELEEDKRYNITFSPRKSHEIVEIESEAGPDESETMKKIMDIMGKYTGTYNLGKVA